LAGVWASHRQSGLVAAPPDIGYSHQKRQFHSVMNLSDDTSHGVDIGTLPPAAVVVADVGD
jgi:hypothetical protein